MTLLRKSSSERVELCLNMFARGTASADTNLLSPINRSLKASFNFKADA